MSHDQEEPDPTGESGPAWQGQPGNYEERTADVTCRLDALGPE
jgi:hypothetical protein